MCRIAQAGEYGKVISVKGGQVYTLTDDNGKLQEKTIYHGEAVFAYLAATLMSMSDLCGASAGVISYTHVLILKAKAFA